MSAKTLQSFYAEHYEPLALRSRRPNTKRLYRGTLNDFDRFLGRRAKLSDFADATVSRFASNRLEAGLSKHTVNKHLFNLLAIWRWAHRKGHVKNWPDVALETPPRRAPVALLPEELASLRRAIERLPGSVGRVAASDYWLAKFLLIWDTGERIGAVMALRWEDVDLSSRWVRFDADHRKGAREDNVLQFAAETGEALAKIKSGRGLVFDWPHSRTYIYFQVGKIMERAGLPNDRLHKFHVIRKSTASHYQAAGGNAQALLGHTSAKVTRSYLDPRIVKTTPAVDLLFRPGE